MVKFGKKTKKSKSSDEEASPLMADSATDDEPSSSRSRKDKEREARRKERSARNADREKRMEEKEESKKSKSKQPKLSQEEQNERDAQLPCCHRFAKFLVKAVHLIDSVIGLTFVVYGALINNFPNKAMEAVATSLTFGSVLLFTSVMGILGFYTTMCNRFGLALSAWSAIPIALFYLVVILSLLASPDKLFDYLTKHKDVLYLNDAELLTIRNILPILYIVMASLAGMEIVRFMVMRTLHEKLVRADKATERIMSRASSNASAGSSKKSSSSKSKGGGGSKRGSNKREGSDRSRLTEPLIDEEQGLGAGSDEDY